MAMLHAIDRALDRALGGHTRGARARWIVPLGAWVTADGTAHVEGRVLSSAFRARDVPPALRRMWALVCRLETDEVPGARVTARSAAGEASGRTDDEGYFSLQLTLRVGAPVRAPYLPIAVHTDGDDGPVQVLATVPGSRARRLIVSDVDDTVLVAHATSRVRHAYHVLLTHEGEREAVPRAAELYRALVRGGGSARAQHNPVAYVSSSPTNVAGVVATSLATHGFPEGPLLLKDFGVDEGKILREGHVEHKIERIARVIDAWPELDVLLIGDTGQSDPAVFVKATERWPDRIRAAWLRDAPGGDGARSDEALRRLAARGVATLRFADVSEARAWALERGWVTGADRTEDRDPNDDDAADDGP